MPQNQCSSSGVCRLIGFAGCAADGLGLHLRDAQPQALPRQFPAHNLIA